jgi:hypothetical protein
MMQRIQLHLTKNNSRCAGFQYLNSTNVSKRTNVFRYVQSIKLQKASIIGLLYVSGFNPFVIKALLSICAFTI